jgi:hypothetical protein
MSYQASQCQVSQISGQSDRENIPAKTYEQPHSRHESVSRSGWNSPLNVEAKCCKTTNEVMCSVHEVEVFVIAELRGRGVSFLWQ